MGNTLSEQYQDPEFAKRVLSQIRKKSRKSVRLMEVCGTHTMTIFKNGIPHLLPDSITLVSGPGCPVCVTAQGEIDAFIALSRFKEVIITTFGDLIRVPGSSSSLGEEKSRGGDIRIVYSSFDALKIAEDHPEKEVVFLGVGFETTAPTVAASILAAREKSIGNYSVLCAHKRVPPALEALMLQKDTAIDGFILPGHVSTIIGTRAYGPFFDRFKIPGVIAGFEPVDILMAILVLVDQIASMTPELKNGYSRAVTDTGNVKAQQVLEEVFDVVGAQWRGIGRLPDSGFQIKEAYGFYDARARYHLEVPEVKDPKGCGCGDVLTGRITPLECPLYKKQCTPVTPVGPCMVSTEGTCAAYYRYNSE